MHECAQAGDNSALLATALSSSGHEDTGVLSVVGTSGPLLASLVPECLPLCGEVTISSYKSARHSSWKGINRDVPGGDTEEDGVEGLELSRVGESLNVCGLGGCVHLCEDLLGEGLFDSVKKLDWRTMEKLWARLLHTGRGLQIHRPPQCPSSQPRPTNDIS